MARTVGLAASGWLFSVGAVAAPPDRVEIGYVFYGGGVQLASMRTTTRFNADRYRVDVRFKTEGLLSWLLDLSLKGRAEGRLPGPDTAVAAPRPLSFRSESGGRWAGRSITLDYQTDGAVAVEIIPPLDEHDTDQVLPAQMRATFDPLSASLRSIMFRTPEAACDDVIPVFDGRRRFDLVLTRGRQVTLKPNKYSRFSGAAVRCDIEYRRIAGYRKKSKQSRSYKIWLARFEPLGLTVPVRLVAPSEWGTMVGHLAALRADGNDYTAGASASGQ